MERRALLAEENKIAARALTAQNAGLVPVCNRPFKSSGFAYQRGGAVDLATIPNAQRLVQSGHISFVTPAAIVATLAPVKLPEPVPAPLPPKVVIVEGDDPVKAFLDSVAETQKTTGAPYRLARDCVMGDPRGSDLYRRAVLVGSERYCRQQGLVGRRIIPPELQ